MFQSVLFFALFQIYTNGEKFDPKKVNYCKLFCGKSPSSGCDCKQRGSRTEVLEKFVEFRQLCIDEHNHWRNYFASGDERRSYNREVADMMVMNYNLELEFLARCYGRSFFSGTHDNCRKMHNGVRAAQNIAGLSIKDFSFKRVKTQIKHWYDGVGEMNWKLYDEYRTSDIKVEHFATFISGAANILGCARIYASNTKKDGFLDPDFVQTLICNYAAKDIEGNISLPGYPINTKGKACSKCPKKFPCHKKNEYKYLCGKLEPIPKDPPYDFEPKKKDRKKKRNNSGILKNNSVLIILFLLCLFYKP
ncbi:uncharacterized protein LOC123009147 [Tribolium madens]|uniref:uncharacterized protein LOC123009147 n=1 Tax=Tribolium madens TaxID=41895 RepID=UPI001CF74B65|nr:uncharacterized protein LOC123009147 [Tribolium madens]